MTNAEVIRQLDNQQLALFIEELCNGELDTIMGFCDLCCKNAALDGRTVDCKECTLQWLEADCTSVKGLHHGLYKYLICKENNMTELDIELQRLRRENVILRKLAINCKHLCDYCKHRDENALYCAESDYSCEQRSHVCICRDCNGMKWELAEDEKIPPK